MADEWKMKMLSTMLLSDKKAQIELRDAEFRFSVGN